MTKEMGEFWKIFTDADQAFPTAMFFRFFDSLINNPIGFYFSQKKFRLYLG